MDSNGIYQQRLSRLLAAMKRRKLDAFLIWDRANTRYLSGFRGSASLICLTAERGYFLTDFRYVTVARTTIPHLRIVQTRPPETDSLKCLVVRHKIRKIGFEESVPYRLFKSWSENLGKIELVEATTAIRRFRERKTRDELRRIVGAQRIAEKALHRVLAECRPGITERSLARRLAVAIEDEGGEKPAFDPIVASGPNAALPHARPGDRQLKKGDFVILDVGASRDGYMSDMTRTVVIGRATDRQRQVYATVLEAQRRAISRIRDGVAAKSVDRAARSWIAAKGHAKHFGHGTGHGVGLEIHESPALNPRSTDTLRVGMVVTVEPGIYIPGWGGVRIEDIVLVKLTGHEILASFPKNLIEINS